MAPSITTPSIMAQNITKLISQHNYTQDNQKIRKNWPNFGKVAKTVAQPQNCQNINFKAQFESPKHLDKTTYEAYKYL